MLPITKETIKKTLEEAGIQYITTATIRQIVALSKMLEKESGEDFVHLEIGNPGLIAESVGVEAEIEALKSGVANTYPDINGLPQIKKAGSRFVKAFLDLDYPPYCIVPTVGSMQASYTLMTILKQRIPEKDKILIFSPGFPAQTHQAKMLGMETIHLDIYDFRGEKLKAKLDELLSDGRVTCMIYSNPNNPSWTNFTEEELKIIGEAATKYDVIVLEDLAYMGMDYRKDFSVPFEEPFIPSVGHYTDNCILLISASKIFSYAGQRIAIVAMSPEVYNQKYPVLEKFYEMPNFGECYVYGVLYTASSGTSHSPQYAMAAMMDRAADGKLEFISHNKEYARRGEKMKDIFLSNSFHLVYDKDGDQEISDGFFFTVGYDGMNSEELQTALLRYGVSSISLPCTGSTKEGVRVCVSMMSSEDLFDKLNTRLKLFHEDHSK